MKLADKRKRYYTMIWMYKKRRDELRKQFGITVVHNGHKKWSDEYKEKSKNLTRKIGTWTRQIKRIDDLTEKLHKIEMAVIHFTGQQISGQVGQKVTSSVKLAKSIYYKFGLENGIEGTILCGKIGSHEKQPSIYRTRFTKSFQTNPKNKEIWLQFKDFYRDRQNVA